MVQSLPQLKSANEITSVVDALLCECFDLTPQQNECISQFFKATVCQEPEQRDQNFERLLRLLTFNDDFILVNGGQKYPFIIPDAHELASVSKTL
jgi:hypothetical protein